MASDLPDNRPATPTVRRRLVNRIQKSALVPYSTGDMYALVADVESYPQFLPWCNAASILSRDGNQVMARLSLAKSGIRHTFVTRNTLEADRRIEMRLVEGPFKVLDGYWTFEPAGSGCLVALRMDFAFASKLLALTLGPIFSKITNTLVDAFVARAGDLHARR